MWETLQLLGLPLLACVMMNTILAPLGIHVLKREVIFIDIALAQIAAIGAIIAHQVFEAHDDSLAGYACAFFSVLIASAFFSFVRRRVLQVSLAVVIGVSYAIAAAAVLFLVGINPGGHVHAQDLLAGGIIWTTWVDIKWCLAVFAAVGISHYLWRKPFGRISEDYDRAVREGLRVAGWDFLFYALFGLVIALAVRIAGVVVVFAFLIIPATISVLFSSRGSTRLVIAWAAGSLASLAGLLFAHYLDFSFGPAVAMFLGIALVFSSGLQLCRRRFSTTS